MYNTMCLAFVTRKARKNNLSAYLMACFRHFDLSISTSTVSSGANMYKFSYIHIASKIHLLEILV
jgi:hypothetical protein